MIAIAPARFPQTRPLTSAVPWRRRYSKEAGAVAIFGVMGASWAENEADIRQLVAAVVDPSRGRPIVCVTKQSYLARPLIDVDALADALTDTAEVWVVGRSSLGWQLTESLPAGLDVWGGRVRVWWPLADLDVINPADHRGFNIFDPQDAARVKDELVAYVRQGTAVAPAIGEELEATVTAVFSHGAEFELRDGFRGFAANAHLSRGQIVYASEAVRLGQVVRVQVSAEPPFGRDTWQLTLLPFAPEPWDRLAAVYEPGMTVEGLVSDIKAFGAFVELLPGARGLLHLSKISDDWVNDPADFLAIDDPVVVHILALDPAARTAELSIRDVPADAFIEPVATIYPGGPSWFGPVEVDEEIIEAPAEDPPADFTTPDLTPALGDAAGPIQPADPEVTEADSPGTAPDRTSPLPVAEEVDEEPEAAPNLAEPAEIAPESPDLAIAELQSVMTAASDAQQQLKATAAAAERSLAQVRAEARALIRELQSEISAAEQRVLRVGRDEVAAIVAEAQEASRHLRGQVDQLRGELEAAVAERGELIAAVSASDARLSSERTRRSAAEKQAAAADQRAAGLQGQLEVIDDGRPEATFLRELHYAYTKSYPSLEDRRRYPFDAPLIGPEFLASLQATQGIQRSRVREVCLHVAVGRAPEIASLELHQLRESAAGDSPFRVRARDGAVAWRVSLQVKSPSARRLHYWQLRDGRVELSKIGTHDDVSIV